MTPPQTRAPGRWLTDRVTRASASGSGEGPDPRGHWPVEPGRYRLVVSRACPWAHRALITYRVLGLDRVISLAVVDPVRDERGWRFWLDPEGRDPVLGIEFLAEAYRRTVPDYAGRITVPALVDTVSGTVVTNDHPQLSTDFIVEWAAFHSSEAPQLLPADPATRAEHDRLAELISAEVNRGVYDVGYATDQRVYGEAYDRLFVRLDRLSERLSTRRFLMGEAISDADIRLFTTLVRFDIVYHTLFRCNRNTLTEMPTLRAYARDLYQLPGFGSTVDVDHIKRHYYLTDQPIVPGIVPAGPDTSWWAAPAD